MGYSFPTTSGNGVPANDIVRFAIEAAEIAALLAKAESEDKVKDERGDDLDPELEGLTICTASINNVIGLP